MKNKLLFLLFLCIGMSSINAQINVGSTEFVRKDPGKFLPEDIDALKATTTIFVYRDIDEPILDKIQKAFEQSWNITKVEFIKYSELSKYSNKQGYSYFMINGIIKTITSSSGMTSEYTHIYLKLSMFIKNKKGKIEEKVFCRIELYPLFTSSTNMSKIIKKSEKEAGKYANGDCQYYNLHPGFLKLWLNVVNENLSNKSTRWLYNSESNPAEIAKMKKETLYIPDFILIKFAIFTGDESERYDEKDLFKGITKYKLLPAEELSDLLLSDNPPAYVMIYTKSSTDVYYTVYNTKTGSIIYSEYDGSTYNPKNKQLLKIYK